MKVLFVSNNNNTKRLYDWLAERCEIESYEKSLTVEVVDLISPDLIVSYNYKYLIGKDVIDRMDGNIVNLHISYLPWNKGSNPNYWSFIENTPKGVTIHQVSEKLDEGNIICQKEVYFDVEKETFATSYEKLHDEIIQLFMDNWETIRDKKYIAKKQSEKGSYHNQQDFQNMIREYPVSWDEMISEYLNKIINR